jgi:hypothetical protein
VLTRSERRSGLISPDERITLVASTAAPSPGGVPNQQ